MCDSWQHTRELAGDGVMVGKVCILGWNPWIVSVEGAPRDVVADAS